MLYDEIKKSVPSGLNELEVARYLYLKCGESFCFDTKINNLGLSTLYQLLNREIDPNSFDDIQVNCNIISKFYSSLLNDFGIDNKHIKYWHSFVNFFINGERWVADLTFGRYTDLSRIHYGDDTCLFGPCYYRDIDSNMVTMGKSFNDILSDIDIKLGYPKHSIIQLKQLLRDAKMHFSFKSTDECAIVAKLKFIFSHIDCLSFGYYESKDFIFELEKLLFDDSDLKKIGSIELIRHNSLDLVDLLQCIYVEFNGSYTYFILCPNLPIYQINVEDFASLLYLGYRPIKGIIPGVDLTSVYRTDNFDELRRYDFIQAKIKRLDNGTGALYHP